MGSTHLLNSFFNFKTKIIYWIWHDFFSGLYCMFYRLEKILILLHNVKNVIAGWFCKEKLNYLINCLITTSIYVCEDVFKTFLISHIYIYTSLKLISHAYVCTYKCRHNEYIHVKFLFQIENLTVLRSFCSLLPTVDLEKSGSFITSCSTYS